MHVPDPQTTVPDEDAVLRARIRSEIRPLLNQQAELDRLETVAAVQEKTMRVVHDIRNPLAAIQAVCDALILEEDDPGQRRRLEMVNDEVGHLNKTLRGALAGTQESDEEPSPVDVDDLARSLVNLLGYQNGEDVIVRTRLETDLRCHLPRQGLTRSIHHLLLNASEACMRGNGGEIDLDCRRDGTQLRIEVVDNGPGLPPDLLRRGLRSYAAVRPGSALGLCSVERFAQELGGSLLLANRENGGARVTIILPADCRVPIAYAADQHDG
jgi:signal transduction histidine kinase